MIGSLAFRHDIEERNNDLKNGITSRKMNKNEEEIYQGAIFYAASFFPYFVEALSIMSPYITSLTETAFTDRYARVGLSYDFFYSDEITLQRRATFLLHEMMHVLNSHFVREERAGICPHVGNIVGDLEINSILENSGKVCIDLTDTLLPKLYNLPDSQTLEAYYKLMKDKEDQQGNGHGSPDNSNSNSNSNSNNSSNSSSNSNNSSNSSSNNNNSNSNSSDSSDSGNSGGKISPFCKGDCPSSNGFCDPSTPEKVADADAAGIERVPETSQANAHANTLAKVRKHREESLTAGTSSRDSFLDLVLAVMDPPKVDWRSIFRLTLNRMSANFMKGKSEETYRSVNRRYDGAVIFPGKRDIVPKIAVGIDTSGSMSQDDFIKTVNEIDGIIKSSSRSKDVKVFSIDTEVKPAKSISSIKDIKLRGGGGTIMTPAFDYVSSLSKKERPNIFVLCTDGGLFYDDWFNIAKRASKVTYKTIILVTSKYGYDDVPDELRKVATVINIDERD